MFTARKLPVTIALVALLGLAFGAGCHGFFVNPKLVSVAVSLSPAPPLVIGDTPTQATATGTYDDNSTKNLTSSASWSMSPTGFATIDTTGKLTGTNPTTGNVNLTATITNSDGSFSGQTGFTVALGNVTKIAVSPLTTTTQTGQTFTLQATATVGQNNAQDDISGSATWTFTVQNTNSVVTGLTAGTVTNSGLPFTVGTLSPTQTFPVTLDVVATYPKSGGGTISSNTVTVTITQ